MRDESLSDLAVSAAAAINDAVHVLKSMNDYGASTGFCPELDQIESDAHRQLCALRARAYAVKRRYSLLATEKGLTP